MDIFVTERNIEIFVSVLVNENKLKSRAWKILSKSRFVWTNFRYNVSYLTGQTSVSSKQKTLHVALDHLIESTTALNNLEEQLSCKEETVDVSTMDAIENEARDLLGILESRLQFVLLNLVKVTSPVAKKG